jgi:hypothetical protein
MINLAKIIAELRAERELLDEVLENLEHLAAGLKRTRGRPPAWKTENTRKADRLFKTTSARTEDHNLTHAHSA